ncbi:MAG TPA: TspO/MBR family protein [Bradyrhizobium sp.]
MAHIDDSNVRKRPVLGLVLFLVLVVGGGLAMGATNLPGGWYAGLTKPWFNPPNWIFAPAWTGLYVLIAIAGWRTFQRNPAGTAMLVWCAQLAFNFSWSPVFFRANLILAALCVIVAMFVLIMAFIVVQWRRDRVSALLFLPYAMWVGFAASLNAAIYLLNS